MTEKLPKGTFTRGEEPTKLSVDYFYEYFKLGGRPDDTYVNKQILSELNRKFGFKSINNGWMNLHWGLNTSGINSTTSYPQAVAMKKSCQLGWLLFNNCSN